MRLLFGAFCLPSNSIKTEWLPLAPAMGTAGPKTSWEGTFFLGLGEREPAMAVGREGERVGRVARGMAGRLWGKEGRVEGE